MKALAVQPDGGIVVAGYFYTLCGQVRNSLGRLNSDATLDLAFSPSPNGAVAALAVQADGKILAGGSFTTLLGQSRSHLGRLNADGSLDTNFNVVVNNTVNTIALQPDGKILLGGSFTQVGTQSHINLARVNSNGSLDTSFTAAASNPVNAIVLQPDGKILVGGDFTLLANQSRPYLGRLNTNGVLDTGFTAAVTVPVQSLALQGDGKIIVSTNGSNLGRLNADGTSDSTFLPASSTNGVVYALALDLEGRAMVGGQFSNLGGQARSNLCRLTASAPATRTLSFDGSTVTWLRGGTSPEIWRANFEASTNGENWINLGDAVHASTGWQLGGLALPSNATIHARGFITSGRQNGSGWVTEASVGAPGVTRQPANRTNNAGTQASFQVEAVGTAPLGYQWRKGGTNLVDSLNVSGTRTPTLTLSNVSVAQAGGYSVVISNAVGNATSRVAALSVADPFILGQPTNQAANAGQSITFRVTAGGTGPLSYQWRKDGALLGPATAAVLTVTNTQWHDRGSYDVVVTGPFGSATSTVATLTVNLAAPDEFNPGPGGIVFALGEQTDGKILLGGAFTSLGGQSQWYRLGRVNRNGSLDTNFHPYAEYYVYSLVVQPDGKI
ncbi:MAG: hypothetical protein NT031_05120, partial [Planctomycetota bacterium]|nr:hypothetical protein [Planctomycetota bacterium]